MRAHDAMSRLKDLIANRTAGVGGTYNCKGSPTGDCSSRTEVPGMETAECRSH